MDTGVDTREVPSSAKVGDAGLHRLIHTAAAADPLLMLRTP